MVKFEEAFNIVMNNALVLREETVALESALNRVISRDIISDINIPAADMSAMDGFACRKADSELPLQIIETIPAGHHPGKAVGEGECSRIMTGAQVPEGADHVVMVEHIEERDGIVHVIKQSNADNIRRKAEDTAVGDAVIKAGTRITPAIIAILASAGQHRVPVGRQLKVGIIATGDELVEMTEKPDSAHIRNCNSHILAALAHGCGCLPEYFGIARDTPEGTEAILEKALAVSDVLLLSGGVSAGDFDFVPETLKKMGGEILVQGVSIKPGKPLIFGTLDERRIFGMPGNPVSTFVSFEMFVRPFLWKSMGHEYVPIIVRALLNETVSRKKADRMEFLPINFSGPGTVIRPPYNGSAHIHSYASADGIIAIPEGVDRIDAGFMVEVRMFEKC